MYYKYGIYIIEPHEGYIPETHLCCIPPPKKNESRFLGQIHDWKHLYLLVFNVYMMCRVSATTPASPLIRKSTTLRFPLWCSHYNLAKRQQFSCPRGTTTMSLKLKNVVWGRWICYFSYCARVFFLLLLHRIVVLVNVRVLFEKSLYDVTFFFY